MSDDDNDGAVTPEPPAESATEAIAVPAAARRSATSRARRIGGRPARGTRPGEAAVSPAATADDREPDAPAGEKPEKKRAEKKQAEEKPAEKGPAEKKPAKTSLTKAEPAADRVRPVTADPRSLLSWLPAALLTVAALVFAVLIAFEAGGDDESGGAPGLSAAAREKREQVLAAAKTCVVRVNSYDYRTLVADQSEAVKCTTGKYKKDFVETFEKVIKKLAPKAKAAQRAEISVAGIQDVSEDGKKWTVLLYGQLSVTNSVQKTPRIDPIPIKATMQLVGDRYLIAAISGAS